MKQTKELIMIVEDDRQIQDFIAYSLMTAGFGVLTAGGVEEAMRKMRSKKPDIMVLDLGLPDGDGLDLIRRVRKFSDIPIIVVSARDKEEDKIEALDRGAEDYITKPFSPLEMVARVKAQLRRARLYSEWEKKVADVLDFAGILIDRSTHTCQLNERTLNLTPTEFKILWLLCENRGKVLSCEELFRKVWGEKYFTNRSNTVMVHIRHLREKMGDATDKPKYIKTVWGVGYKIDG